MATLPEDAAVMWAEMKAGGAAAKAWILLGMTEDRKGLTTIASGRCGIRHLARFLNDNEVQWGVFRVFALGLGGKQPKLCLFTFKGSRAPLKAKAAAGNLTTAVSKAFDGTHLDFEFNGLDDVTEATVVAKLSSARGSHKPTGYEFGTGDDADLEEDELAAAAEAARLAAEAEAEAAAEAARLAAIEAAEAEAVRKAEEERQRRLAILPPRSKTEVKKVARDPTIEGFDLSELTERYILEGFGDVEDAEAWVVVSVAEDAPTKIRLDGLGAGGMEEVVAVLRDDDIQYGAVRVASIDRKGARLSIRPKLITFTWTGGSVDTKTKRRNTGVLKPLGVYFGKPTIELKVNGDRADLSEAKIVATLRTCVRADEFRFGQYDRDSQATDYIAQLEAAGLKDAALKGELKHAAAGGAGGGDDE